ncbi:BTAD domain-containing putative transcriptional regulator [Nocardioides mangrovi]|uniref:AAA family ATPase n=1 Tax=Nocardioides mangrovi TaxID=2874580 RepID=A0ABS7U6L4_9ACTN|nr:BTAD domain-containing putative transcriptional regulator [Nocardioides mangrovi]MBZ5736594.1 AAA family ATPase [Nocardioides mangrovi]
MEVSVLGPVEVTRSGEPVDLGTPKQRALISALALSRGWPVSVDGIVDLLWEDAAPPGVTATLQAYVSQLRRALEPDRERRAPATVLVTVAPGYALRVPDDSIDASRFEQAVVGAHRTLQPLGEGWGGGAVPAADLSAAADALDAGLALWRGVPYVELGDADAAVAERARLDDLRLVALEDRAVAALALGRHATVAAELESLTAAHPLRERLWGLRALALTRSGRQADALEVLREVREVLDAELGIEPSAALRELQTAVLRQDPALDWAAPEGGLPAPAPVSAAPPAPPPVAHPVAHPAVDQVAPWPMVGRDPDLELLLGALARAETGVPTYAAVTGEPGIGKSRLSAELVREARLRGATVLVGRCSQDDGAPPLWPWKAVLDGLGQELLPDAAAGAAEDEGSRFRTWERIAGLVRDAAAGDTVVVVLDDLHWADTPTLRVLRLLVETVDQARLLVVGTWRLHPEPTGALADVAESLARMHALRLQLGGLPSAAVARVFEAVSQRELTREQAAALQERTDGNPFYLVEFARLAAERREGTVAAEEELPTAVTDVLHRRLLRLPEQTVTTLRAAAVLGRSFDAPTLATVTGIDEDDLLDIVDPAQAAGLVREDGIDQYLFAHALVRDTLRGSLSVSRRARVHARAAEALEGVPGRETEVARHWREAGPSYADRAWRSGVDAAGLARRFYAYDEAAELLRGALVSMEGDAGAGLQERYDLLMLLIDDLRWAALLPPLVGAVEEAIEVGKQLRDPEAVARAALSATQGVLWRSAPPGMVNETVVDALRGSLERLPAEDSDLRARSLVSLARELDSGTWSEERRALSDEALAMARRVGDPRLVMDVAMVAFVALWVPPTAEERLALITESVELARQTGSERAHLVATCLRAAVLNELGRPEEMYATARAAMAEAERLRILYGQIVICGILAPWHAMSGRQDEAEDLVERCRALASSISHANADESVLSCLLALRLWQGRSIEMVPALLAFDESPYPFHASVAVYLWRAGEEQRARDYLAEHDPRLQHMIDTSLLSWCHSAEIAFYLGDPGLAADVYAMIAPYAGHNCSAGSYLGLGPVDSYLALAAAATGESAVAARHADDALRLAEEWGVTLVAEWLTGLRRTHGF